MVHGRWRTALAPAAATVAALLLAACGDGLADDAASACIPDAERGTGIKATVVTVWNGTPELLPEGIGVTEDCTRPLHTIDDSSYVYIVGEEQYTVGDFFDVWEDDPSTRPGSSVENVSLNGQPFNGDYRAIVFEDEQRIVVAFGDRRPQ